MSADGRLFVLSLLALAGGSVFALAGVLTGAQWVELVVWVLGLHAAGAATGAVAKSTGEWLSASAQKMLRREPESG